jgi:aspartate carbamoyltransferase catalytic subunit
MNHLLSVLSLNKNQILSYISKAEKFKKNWRFYDKMKNRTLINIFFEPSTRTSSSFQAAMIKLGGNVINITEKYSSVEKGESFCTKSCVVHNCKKGGSCIDFVRDYFKTKYFLFC